MTLKKAFKGIQTNRERKIAYRLGLKAQRKYPRRKSGK